MTTYINHANIQVMARREFIRNIFINSSIKYKQDISSAVNIQYQSRLEMCKIFEKIFNF